MSITPNDPGPGGRRDWSQLNQWLLWIGLAAAVAWLFFGHGEHLFNLLPFLFVLACPLMHLFGHRHGGGHHGHSHRHTADPEEHESPRSDARGGGHVH